MTLIKPNLEKPFFQVFPDKYKLVNDDKCISCENNISESDFKDELSKKEYSISGMCQKCQDLVFNK